MPDPSIGPVTLAKVRRNLLPFAFLLYIAAYLDRINVGFAALQMNRALGLGDAAFGLGAGLFFVGYFLFEIPSNLILHRVGARTWIVAGSVAVAMLIGDLFWPNWLRLFHLLLLGPFGAAASILIERARKRSPKTVDPLIRSEAGHAEPNRLSVCPGGRSEDGISIEQCEGRSDQADFLPTSCPANRAGSGKWANIKQISDEQLLIYGAEARLPHRRRETFSVLSFLVPQM